MFLEDTDTDPEVSIAHVSEGEELTGKMGSDFDEERLAHSVLEDDGSGTDDGLLLEQSIDYSVGSFTPDLLYEQLVQNYRNAQRLFGPTIIRQLTGYDGEFIERNLKIAEFREELKRNIGRGIERLEDAGLIDDDGVLTDAGKELAALTLVTDELEHLRARGLGRRETRERSHYGERDRTVAWRGQRYKDVDVRATVRAALRRSHPSITREDLRASERVDRGAISIVYAFDASGSMRGEKIGLAKRAGIALAHQAIGDRNRVGLLVFTSKVEERIPPTDDFSTVLHALANARAGQETDIALAIRESIAMFPHGARTKHLVLLTDAVPTTGAEPARLTLEAASAARDAGVTVSVVGLNLEREGERLAERVVELGEGRLYRVKRLDELDLLVLEDYESVRARAGQ